MNRLLAPILCLLVCAGAVGIFWDAPPIAVSLGALIGGALGLLAWLFWDDWRATLLIDWLRRLQNAPDDTPLPPPRLSGVWRMTAERLTRLLRQQRQQGKRFSRRLEDIRDALHASPNGVIMLNGAGRIRWLNRSACRHFGLDEARDIAQTVTHLLRDPIFVAYYTQRDFSHGITLNSPFSTLGRPLHLTVHIYPYGKRSLLILSQDTTAIERNEAMRRDFVANVSHELRTPLTVLAGFIETLQTLPLAESERDDYLARMARHAARMQNLVGDLLLLSRLEASPPPGFEQWTPIRTLLAACVAEAQALAAVAAKASGAAQHVIVFPPEAELDAEIAGSADELQSAFINLANNAIRYTPPGGRIEIRWTPTPEGGAAFAVQDNGPGIAPEHLPRLTERFYRVDSGRSSESGGTGLGLSIVKHVLQRHDARLKIHSTPGAGACFTVVFPADRICRI
ncbi:MAG: phosphate regulon sensor histidine kinase PhoR [Zoogloeaceae bacterium]|nr:phosphate regulon sensor histidine kinase PhoR [Zoogloeaceae bacterium]